MLQHFVNRIEPDAMTPLHIEPVPTLGGEADRLTYHLNHCDLARGRWASVGNGAEILRTLLLGHVVTTVLVLTAAAVGLSATWAWLMG